MAALNLSDTICGFWERLRARFAGPDSGPISGPFCGPFSAPAFAAPAFALLLTAVRLQYSQTSIRLLPTAVKLLQTVAESAA